MKKFKGIVLIMLMVLLVLGSSTFPNSKSDILAQEKEINEVIEEETEGESENVTPHVQSNDITNGLTRNADTRANPSNIKLMDFFNILQTNTSGSTPFYSINDSELTLGSGYANLGSGDTYNYIENIVLVSKKRLNLKRPFTFEGTIRINDYQPDGMSFGFSTNYPNSGPSIGKGGDNLGGYQFVSAGEVFEIDNIKNPNGQAWGTDVAVPTNENSIFPHVMSARTASNGDPIEWNTPIEFRYPTAKTFPFKIEHIPGNRTKYTLNGSVFYSISNSPAVNGNDAYFTIGAAFNQRDSWNGHSVAGGQMKVSLNYFGYDDFKPTIVSESFKKNGDSYTVDSTNLIDNSNYSSYAKPNDSIIVRHTIKNNSNAEIQSNIYTSGSSFGSTAITPKSIYTTNNSDGSGTRTPVSSSITTKLNNQPVYLFYEYDLSSVNEPNDKTVRQLTNIILLENSNEGMTQYESRADAKVAGYPSISFIAGRPGEAIFGQLNGSFEATEYFEGVQVKLPDQTNNYDFTEASNGVTLNNIKLSAKVENMGNSGAYINPDGTIMTPLQTSPYKITITAEDMRNGLKSTLIKRLRVYSDSSLGISKDRSQFIDINGKGSDTKTITSSVAKTFITENSGSLVIQKDKFTGTEGFNVSMAYAILNGSYAESESETDKTKIKIDINVKDQEAIKNGIPGTYTITFKSAGSGRSEASKTTSLIVTAEKPLIEYKSGAESRRSEIYKTSERVPVSNYYNGLLGRTFDSTTLLDYTQKSGNFYSNLLMTTDWVDENKSAGIHTMNVTLKDTRYNITSDVATRYINFMSDETIAISADRQQYMNAESAFFKTSSIKGKAITDHGLLSAFSTIYGYIRDDDGVIEEFDTWPTGIKPPSVNKGSSSSDIETIIQNGTLGKYNIGISTPGVNNTKATKVVKMQIISDEAILSKDQTAYVDVKDKVIRVSKAKQLLDDAAFITTLEAEAAEKTHDDINSLTPIVEMSGTDRTAIQNGTIKDTPYVITFKSKSTAGNGQAKKTAKLLIVPDNAIISPDESEYINGESIIIDNEAIVSKLNGKDINELKSIHKVTAKDIDGTSILNNVSVTIKEGKTFADIQIGKEGTYKIGVKTAKGTTKEVTLTVVNQTNAWGVSIPKSSYLTTTKRTEISSIDLVAKDPYTLNDFSDTFKVSLGVTSKNGYELLNPNVNDKAVYRVKFGTKNSVAGSKARLSLSDLTKANPRMPIEVTIDTTANKHGRFEDVLRFDFSSSGEVFK